MADVSGRALFRPDAIPTGLQGFWKLDEASGTRADSSGNGNTLTDNNTVTNAAFNYWEDGENSADFESANSESLSRTDAAQVGLDQTGAFSLAAWIKLESFPSEPRVMDKLSGATGWNWFIGTGPRMRLSIGAVEIITTTGGLLKLDRWTHIAVVYDQTNVSFYIDGNVHGVTAHSADPVNTTADFFMGDRATTGRPFDGLMKDVAVWNVALTPLEIKSLALGQDLSAFTIRPDSSIIPTPTALWKMNEVFNNGSGGTRADSIGALDLTDAGTAVTDKGYIEGAGAFLNARDTEYLFSADNAAFDLAGDYTEAGWFNFDAFTTEDGIFGQASDTSNYWSFGLAEGNPAQFGWQLRSGGVFTFNQTAAHGMSVGTWHHIAIRRSGNVYDAFVDGKSVLNFTQAGAVPVLTGEFRIGRDTNGGANQHTLVGKISDVAFWSTTALSDAEIRQLATGLDINDQALISYHKCNEASGALLDSFGSKTFTDTNTVGAGSGQVGDARDFVKANSEHFTRADDIDYDPRYLTVAAWVNPDDFATDGPIIDKKNGGANTAWQLLINNTAGTCAFNVGNGSSSESATSAAFTAAQYNHVIGVYDGANPLNYANGVDKVVGAALAGTFPGNAAPIQVGKAGPLATFLEGLVDEIVFWQRAIGDEEAKALYLKGFNGLEATNSDQAPAVTTDIENRGLFLVYPA